MMQAELPLWCGAQQDRDCKASSTSFSCSAASSFVTAPRRLEKSCTVSLHARRRSLREFVEGVAIRSQVRQKKQHVIRGFRYSVLNKTDKLIDNEFSDIHLD
jgi:hypothetical protein